MRWGRRVRHTTVGRSHMYLMQPWTGELMPMTVIRQGDPGGTTR